MFLTTFLRRSATRVALSLCALTLLFGGVPIVSSVVASGQAMHAQQTTARPAQARIAPGLLGL